MTLSNEGHGQACLESQAHKQGHNFIALALLGPQKVDWHTEALRLLDEGIYLRVRVFSDLYKVAKCSPNLLTALHIGSTECSGSLTGFLMHALGRSCCMIGF